MRKLISLALLLPLVTLSAQTLSERLKQYAEGRHSTPVVIDAAAAANEIAARKVSAVDVRDTEVQSGRLPGAIAMPLDKLTGSAVNSLLSGRLLIVGAQPEQAIEAAAIFRLSGLQATAVDSSYTELARLVAAPSTEAKRNEPPATPGNGQLPASVTTAPVESRPPAPERTPVWTNWALIGALLVIAALVIHRWFWSPRKKLKPAQAAIDILAANDVAGFEHAFKLLRGAIDSGLKPKDLADARFALAYAGSRMGETRMEEAITEMRPVMDNSPSKEAAYLDLWLQVRAKRYEAGMRRYVEHGQELGDYRQTKLLGGIALLEQAFVAVGRQAYEESVQLFKQLIGLQVLNDHVPTDLVNQQVAFAVEALLSSETDKAREGFNRAAQEANTPDSALYARVGLALCDWRTDPEADLDSVLRELANQADILLKSAEAESLSPAPPNQEKAAEEQVLTPAQLLVRNLRLMHAVSLLNAFKRLPEECGLSKDALKELCARLSAVQQIDPKMGDPLLIEGLMRYYFADSEAERSQALALLDQASEREISVPEVNYMVECEKALAKLQENGTRDYLSLLKQYLGEETVPLAERQKLQDRLKNVKLFKEIGDVNLQPSTSPKDAALRDLTAVSGILHRRVERLVGREKDERIATLLTAIKGGTDTISEQVSEVYRAQTELMAATAEHLLKEEELRRKTESKSAKSGSK